MKAIMYNLLVVCLFLSSDGMAKIKIVDRSTKKVPEWIGIVQKDYIITSAIAPTLEEAKRQCFDNIRKAIIESVAQNVRSTSQSAIQQEAIESGIVRFLDSYTAQFEAESAKLPYLSGISELKAEASYWEKRQDTETKVISYAYSVKYPFSSLELKKLVWTFHEQDQAMESKLQTLENLYTSVGSLEEIDKALNALKELDSYFFDPVRRGKVSALQNNFRALYKQITIQEMENRLGEYIFRFILQGRQINVAQRPQVKSETLSQLRVELQDGEWHVFYDCSTCDPMEENKAEITFIINGQRIVHTFYVDVDRHVIRLYPIEEMYLTAQIKTDSCVGNIDVRMQVQNKGKENCILQGVTLDVPGLEMPLYIGNLKLPIECGSTRNVSYTYPDMVLVVKKQHFRKNILQGSFELINEQGKSQMVKFSLPFQTNW